MTSDQTDGQPIVCIFGSYSPKVGDPLWEQAYAIGYALAQAGYVVANGGYDGIMQASAKGAKDAGGSTIGVTCSVFSGYRGKALQANPYIDREIHHPDVFERIREMIHMSAAYVVLPGGTGTLSEFAMIWEFVCKGLVSPRPIFVVGDFWRPVMERILSVRPRHGKHLHCVDNAEQIVAIVKQTAPRPANGRTHPD